MSHFFQARHEKKNGGNGRKRKKIITVMYFYQFGISRNKTKK